MMPSAWPLPGQWLLALFAGAFAVTGFAPFGMFFVPVLSLALLFHLWRGATTVSRAAWLGYAFGLGLMGAGASWIRISIAQFGGVTDALAWLITLLFVLLMAAYVALAGGVAQWLRRGADGPWLWLVLPAVWVLVEWLRNWLFTGFPWLSMGYSQIDAPLAAYAPVFGVFGPSLAVALTAALLNHRAYRLALPAVLALWAGGLALQQFSWTEPSGEPIEVSLLQAGIPQDQKWLPEMRQKTFDLYLGMTASVRDSQIVIWPETAVPAFDHEVEAGLLRPLHARMRAQQRDLLLGIVASGENGRYYNAMLSLGHSGRDRYDKRHLVPFGEYLPFDSLLRPVLDFIRIPMSSFSAGDDSTPLVTLAGQPVGVSICYEDAFGQEIIRALPEATLLVNASNDAWFGDSLAPHQHLEIARMRALESGRYLLRATNTGISAIIDAQGSLSAVSPQFERAALSGQVTPRGGSTPFAYWGDKAVVLLALSSLLFGWLRSRSG